MNQIDRPLPAIGYRKGGEEYRGLSDFRGTVQMLSLAVVAAFASAAPLLLCMVLNLARPFFLLGILQGLLLAYALMWVFSSVRLRRMRIAFAVTMFASVLAIAFLHAGFYLRDVFVVYGAVARRSGGVPAGFSISRGGPFVLYSIGLKMTVGHGGFLGYLIYRMRDSLYTTAIFVHAAITPMMAWKICKPQVSAAFCSACACWMGKPRNASVVPSEFRDFLVDTVKSADIDKALALTHVVADLPLGTSCAIARSHRCPVCGEHAIDVIQKTYGRRNSAEVVVLPPIHVSQEFDDALRSDPVIPVEDEATDNADLNLSESDAKPVSGDAKPVI